MAPTDIDRSLWSLPRPVAFVLSGGGSLGAMQVGMLEALAERSIIPDLVVGTSIGAVNGAVVASDPRGAAHRLSHLWLRFDSTRVFPHNVLRQLGTLRRQHTHLFEGAGLVSVLMETLAGGATFDTLAIPLHVVTTDVATGVAKVITSGPLIPALTASAAIPGIFPAVAHEGSLLYDGGLVANVPIQQAVDAGARSLVILDCTYPGHAPIRPSTLMETMLFSATVVLRQQTAAALAAVPADVPVLSLPGPKPRAVSPLSFAHTAALIEAAYDAARAFLEGAALSFPIASPA